MTGSNRTDGVGADGVGAQGVEADGARTGALEALLDRVRFGADGLVPAVAQQHDTREVLMVAWMDRATLAETLTTRRGTYFSRSRQERWRKGDTSGHVQHVVRVSVDCDGDTVLLEVDQVGPACHTGSRSCFDDRVLLDPAVPA